MALTMQGDATKSSGAPPRAASVLLALALTLLLTAAWALRDWALLSQFHLPDTDDMMRLAQVRDWLGGQAFDDMTQHRLGPIGGASMHWSRLADFGPAALILVLSPVLGQTGAAQAMLVIYPATLFLVAMLVGGQLSERLVPGTRALAIVVMALSFPAASLFIPGRIDHHGLQIVLILWFVERLVVPPSSRSGAGAGIAAAVSLAIGLETLPLIVAGMAALFWRYADESRASRQFNQHIAAFAAALGAITLIFVVLMRPHIWPGNWCDGFTPASSTATLTAATVFAVLALSARRVDEMRMRLLIGAVAGAAALPVLLDGAYACFAGPYAPVDPLLRHVWLPYVGEARGLFTQVSPGRSIGYGAMTLLGTAALAFVLAQGQWRKPSWRTFALVYLSGVMVALMQVRATYIVSALATVPIAVILARVRTSTENPLLRVGIWVAAAGLIWNQLGMIIDARLVPQATARPACSGADQATALNALPRGRVIAPLDSGAVIIGNTPDSAIGAPYHRNNTGNAAIYRFFLGSEAQAHAIARNWRTDYVLVCSDSFAELGPLAGRNGQMITDLRAGRPPAWLTRVTRPDDQPLIYRVAPDGPRRAP